jgi:hypothetical protein
MLTLLVILQVLMGGGSDSIRIKPPGDRDIYFVSTDNRSPLTEARGVKQSQAAGSIFRRNASRLIGGIGANIRPPTDRTLIVISTDNGPNPLP